MNWIIIVEDVREDTALLESRLQTLMDCTVVRCGDVAEARTRATAAADPPVACIMSLKISPDEYTPVNDVPTLLVTHGIPMNTRARLNARKLIDTVPGYGGGNIDFIISQIRQIPFRKEIRIACYLRDKSLQGLLRRMISTMGFAVQCPVPAQTAPAAVAADEGIHLGIFDTGLHRISLEDTIARIRRERSREDLCIIVLTDEGLGDEEELNLLYAGANHCLRKRFSSALGLEHFQITVHSSLMQVIAYLRMRHMAQRDSLTGAYTRRYFMEIGAALFANYQRGDISLAVGMIDIDDFKAVNDTYGHPAGDAVIAGMSALLFRELRRNDIICRYGGEEFCLLLTGRDSRNSVAVLERLRSAVADMKITHGKQSIPCTVSVGGARGRADSLQELISRADAALYRAKDAGKNRLFMDDNSSSDTTGGEGT
ncbi:MAG: GGDEF domain-containing protein [Fibrobacterota bacterium]